MNSFYKKSSIFLILLFPILFIKQCEKRATHFLKEVAYIPCDESYSDIVGANFSTNCVNNLSKIPDFQLLSHNGDTITNSSLIGENYILHFFFAACPVVCKQNISKISDYIYAKDRYGNKPFEEEEIKILSISIDNDSPEQMRRYMGNFRDIDTGVQKKIDTNSNWFFLTGDKDYVRQFASSMSQFVENNFKSKDEDHYGYGHSEYVLLVDKEGFFRMNIDSLLWSAQTHNEMKILTKDIQAMVLAQNSQEYKTIKISKENSDTISNSNNVKIMQ